jgi:hypothetical protein
MFIAGVLIVGLQPVTYGYNTVVLNNQITTIEMAKNALKSYDCDCKAVEATRYLKNVIENSYSTSDETIIQLAAILDIDTYSDETLDKITNSILTIKAQEELQNIEKQQEEKMRWNKIELRDTIIGTVLATILAGIFAYGVYSDISNIITHNIMSHENNLINQMVKRISNNNALATPNANTLA